MTGTVSVIIPTYNRAEYLPACLDSILAQTMPPHQVIVVNDGSTDNTEDAVAPYRDRIEYITKENSGKAANVNLALARCTGDYIWVFDDDDVALPHFIACQIGQLDDDPDLGFTYSNFCFAYERDGVLVQGETSVMLEVPPERILTQLLVSCYFPQVSCLTRRQCFDELSGFDEKQARSEDYDFLLRLSRRYRGRSVDSTTMLVRLHEGQRGAAAISHGVADRDNIHLKYDQMVFEKAYRDFEISDYLPLKVGVDVGENPLDQSQRREALLLRATAMGRRALWSYAAKDLTEAAALDCPEPLSERESEYCRGLFSDSLAIAILTETPNILAELRAFFRTSLGKRAATDCLRGYYYATASDLHGQNFTRLLNSIWCTIRITGIAAIFTAAITMATGRLKISHD